jgi:hypothetical protein
MLPDWIIPQAILASAGVLFILLLRHRYRATVSLTARRKMYQYQVFALRDQAIRMVANGTVSQDDKAWMHIYSYINDTAKTVTTDEFFTLRHGFRFFVMVLSKIPEVPKDIKALNSAPNPVKQLWMRTAKCILVIAWDGNTAFRWCFLTLLRVGTIYNFIVKTIPEKYAALQELAGTHATPVPG